MRSCDLSFYIDPGHEIWKEEMYESLFIAIYLPMLHCLPWTYKRSESVLAMKRILRGMQKTKERDERVVLRKFLLFTRRLSSM